MAMNSTQDTGRVTKVAQLPWLITRARRMLDSSMEPSSRPSTKGPLGNLNTFRKKPSTPAANMTPTSKKVLFRAKEPTTHRMHTAVHTVG